MHFAIGSPGAYVTGSRSREHSETGAPSCPASTEGQKLGRLLYDQKPGRNHGGYDRQARADHDCHQQSLHAGSLSYWNLPVRFHAGHRAGQCRPPRAAHFSLAVALTARRSYNWRLRSQHRPLPVNDVYHAGPGWDPVTGWGSPNAQVLIPLLDRG
jgi:hypothetical protein